MREMIKTAMENEQHLIIEGAYIPFDWAEDFCEQEREKIRYCCLIMIPNYIEHHFDDIKRFANVIEKRRDETQYSKASLCRDNAYNEQMCKRYQCPYIRIDTEYRVDFTLA